MIYLLRHGETVWNRANRLQGQLDSPLSRTGIAQIEAIGQFLRDTIEDHSAYSIVSSPLGRAWQSAVIVAEALGHEAFRIAIEPRLKEIAYGAYEGLTFAEVEHAEPGVWERRRLDEWLFRPPGGENYAELSARVAPWLHAQSEQTHLIVVCHGGTSRVIRGLYADLAPEKTVELTLAHGEVYRLTQGRIETLASQFAP
ncbi:MAG: histidine phosphatase family protein [Alphaproteobacteria bacterium]